MNALGIFQTYLDEMSAIVMKGDFAAYADRVALPFHMLTERARFVVDTVAELQAGFDDFRQTLKIQQVTDLIRLADSASLLSEGLMSGRYVTHMLSHANRIVPPFTSQMTLRCEAGTWRAVSISNALANDQWPLRMPVVATEVKFG